MTRTLALVLAVALIAFLWIAVRSTRSGARSSARRETELLLLCRHDAERAERLIELELRRAPQISRGEAIRRAVARYRRDNH